MDLNPARGRLALIAITGIAAVSSASIMIRFARAEAVPPLVIAAARLLLASAVLLPLAAQRERGAFRALTRREWVLVMTSGIALALHFGFWIYSLDLTSVMSSVTLLSTYPLMVALTAVPLLHERLSRLTLIGLLVAAVGALLISASDAQTTGDSLLGDALALLSAVSVTGYMLIGRKLRQTVPVMSYGGLAYAIAGVVCALLVIARGESWIGFSAVAYVWLVLLALVPQLIGHTAINYILGHVPAALVGIILLAEPVGASLLAVALLGEVPTPVKVLGGLFVLAGIFIALRGGESTAVTPQVQAEVESAV